LSPEQFNDITKIPDSHLFKVLDFIEKANESEVPLRLNCVVMKRNKDTIIELIKYAKEK
jgi:molybdenum cofactor biosynthesis enzyme MoaA